MRKKRGRYRTRSNQYKKPGKRRRKKIKRDCLRCQREFMAEGIYNRICPDCQSKNENASPLALPENYTFYPPEKKGES